MWAALSMGGTMDGLREAAAAFLGQRRIAVAGVARDGGNPANIIYRRLRGAGYDVFAVNPNAVEAEGDPCHASVTRIPGGVDGVVIATPPWATLAVVQDCVEAGVPRVWIHRSFGTGSVSTEAVDRCRSAGIELIPGACPMMFLDPVDTGHRCMRWLLGAMKALPNIETSAQYTSTID
jgi:uncharacterized protein